MKNLSQLRHHRVRRRHRLQEQHDQGLLPQLRGAEQRLHRRARQPRLPGLPRRPRRGRLEGDRRLHRRRDETGGRVFRAAKYLDDEPFLVTYGDGLAERRHRRPAGLPRRIRQARHGHDRAADESVRGHGRRRTSGEVTQFREKPRLDGWINIGFIDLRAAGACSTSTRTASSSRGRWSTWRTRGSCRPTGTTASGSRWTPSASRRC